MGSENLSTPHFSANLNSDLLPTDRVVSREEQPSSEGVLPNEGR